MEQAKEKNKAIEMYMKSNIMCPWFHGSVKSSLPERYQGIIHDSICLSSRTDLGVSVRPKPSG
ncbi:hypothetical protein DSLASN_07660 [Desulfoluna limicola]|uniref:Uncharacterized protein n=1 Tax=Desulfoluna limicola TaxID=2810562 RepID=A0ABM7PD78_9BACT|nr:hypothetical protein DSLASN_07660 [Desulfoluna limicola]